MDIITTARRFEVTPEIREHARRRLEKLQRYFDRIDEVHVVLATEKYRQIAEVALRARGTEIISREESDDMLTSIDRVVDRLERQVKRISARRKERKTRRPPERGPVPAGAAGAEEAEEGSEVEDTFSPVVIHQEGFHAEAISVEDAIELMRQREEDFLLFTNARTGHVALVHLRPDGNYGFVESA